MKRRTPQPISQSDSLESDMQWMLDDDADDEVDDGTKVYARLRSFLGGEVHCCCCLELGHRSLWSQAHCCLILHPVMEEEKKTRIRNKKSSSSYVQSQQIANELQVECRLTYYEWKEVFGRIGTLNTCVQRGELCYFTFHNKQHKDDDLFLRCVLSCRIASE